MLGLTVPTPLLASADEVIERGGASLVNVAQLRPKNLAETDACELSSVRLRYAGAPVYHTDTPIPWRPRGRKTNRNASEPLTIAAGVMGANFCDVTAKSQRHQDNKCQ